MYYKVYKFTKRLNIDVEKSQYARPMQKSADFSKNFQYLNFIIIIKKGVILLKKT